MINIYFVIHWYEVLCYTSFRSITAAVGYVYLWLTKCSDINMKYFIHICWWLEGTLPCYLQWKEKSFAVIKNLSESSIETNLSNAFNFYGYYRALHIFLDQSLINMIENYHSNDTQYKTIYFYGSAVLSSLFMCGIKKCSQFSHCNHLKHIL